MKSSQHNKKRVKGKKPYLEEKKILVKEGKNPKNYLVKKRLHNKIEFVNRMNGELLVVQR